MSKHGHARTSEPTVAGPTVTNWRADIHAGLRNFSEVASLRCTAHSCGVSVCDYYINTPCAVHVFTPCGVEDIESQGAICALLHFSPSAFFAT
jgi:hypothetical protein